MTAKPGVPPQVEQVRIALHREFDELIDNSDYTHPDPDQQERKFLSRALAALVARKLSGHDSREVVDYLVDGRADMGIDAVVPLNGGLHICFIQSKWNYRGNAGFSAGDARAFFEGFRLLEDRKFDRFNENLRRYAEQIKHGPWDPRSKVTFLIALMGPGELHPDVELTLDDYEASVNHFGSFISHEVWGGQRIWEVIRDDLAMPDVELIAKLDQWFNLGQPYSAYQGRVPAADVADWFDQHRERLFDQNIRQPLGLTEVNQGLVETLIENPESFWYRNNGMTILCDTVDVRHWNKAAYGPVELTLRGASVVNGAQTAMATYEAMRKAPDAVGRAYVGLKVISTKDCPENFGATVTRATNTQNHVGRRELVVALDPVQSDIRLDFALTLQKEYVFKAGEKEPTAEVGCSVVEAAVALACAHSNPDLAIRAKRSTDLLWEEGTYKLLFGDQPSALQIWRSVQVYRAVRTALYGSRANREGRAQTIAEYGDTLVGHIVLQHIDAEEFESADADWEVVLESVPDLANRAIAWLIYRVDHTYGQASQVSSALSNPERYRELTRAVLEDLASNSPVPDLPAEYRPAPVQRRPRRPNAVPTLIDAQRLDDGTTLYFEASTIQERDALRFWLVEDPRRGQASWVNDRRKPLLWAADGSRYTPTGLVKRIWKEAGWTAMPVSVQGPSRWHLPGEGSLWDLAKAILDAVEAGEE